jgi:P27 family predicted phage terminase small subunit
MGNKNSGRRPAPTRLKVLRGTLRTNRTNHDEPKTTPAPESFDQPPEELAGDAAAIAEWARVVPTLRVIGIIAAIERSALIALCQHWSRYVDAHQHIRTEGMVIPGEKGPIINPYLMVADQAFKNCKTLWVEFGLTPSSRSKISAIPKPETVVSKWAGLL